jgi:type I restriction enzyme S subunit
MAKRVPKLRFPEFANDGEWEEKNLENVSVFVSEKTNLNKVTLENYVSTENLLTDFGGVTTASKLPDTKNLTKYMEGDILFSNIRPYLKKVWLSNRTGGTSNDILVIRSISKINKNFLFYMLTTDTFIDYVMKGAKGVKMPRGDLELIKKYPIRFPRNEKEQQKIADTLSSLDDLISAENDKLQALQSYKKGLMQQLFPKEGERVPKLRFPEFVNDEEWVERKLGEVSTIIMGVSPKSTFYNNNKQGLPLLQGNADIKNRLSAPRVYTSEVTKKCNASDILLSVRAPVGYVAKSIHNACLGRGLCALSAINDNNQEFLYQLLLCKENQWTKISQGGTFDSVNSTDIKNLITFFPKNNKEQQKIADTLSTLDNLIESQSKKIETLKRHKKGLMQKMFMSDEER